MDRCDESAQAWKSAVEARAPQPRIVKRDPDAPRTPPPPFLRSVKRCRRLTAIAIRTTMTPAIARAPSLPPNGRDPLPGSRPSRGRKRSPLSGRPPVRPDRSSDQPPRPACSSCPARSRSRPVPARLASFDAGNRRNVGLLHTSARLAPSGASIPAIGPSIFAGSCWLVLGESIDRLGGGPTDVASDSIAWDVRPADRRRRALECLSALQRCRARSPRAAGVRPGSPRERPTGQASTRSRTRRESYPGAPTAKSLPA